MHTPGPWHYLGDSLTHRQFDVYAPGSAPHQHICTVNNLSVDALWKRDAKQAESNARLIARAPDLKAALAWALDQIEDDLDPDHQAALAHARSLLED
jgi:hypothetical protein